MRMPSAVLAVLASAAPVWAQPIPVEVHEEAPGVFTLHRNGEAFEIEGAGGTSLLEELAAAGANSIRTWGVDGGTGAFLDRAHELGITVSLGIWLDHGVDYSNPSVRAAQRTRVRNAVLAHKDHPALLMWGLGNEMEGFGDGNNPALWQHIEALAAEVESIDPNHPTMTVIAEIGGSRIPQIHQYCPSLDIIGINSYGGGTSLPQRYRSVGGTKPYVVTEYGPPLTSESGQTSWGAPYEQTSTAKARSYLRAFNAFAGDTDLCLGSYVFHWGDGGDPTAMWYGTFLPDGSKLEVVDLLTNAWGGEPPANRTPTIVSFALSGPAELESGDLATASLSAFDPDGDEVEVTYMLRGDPWAGGGTAVYPDAVVESADDEVTIQIPQGDRAYRLFAYVRDGRGGAATASIPLYGEAGEAPVAELPANVYSEGDEDGLWAPSGYMGSDVRRIGMNLSSPDNPHSGDTALRVSLSGSSGWGGVVWQDPANDWGGEPGGWNLQGAERLVFWARGETGGEVVTFGFGLFGDDAAYPDTAGDEIQVTLGADWTRYAMDLDELDLSRIKSGFYWTANARSGGLVFHLDDIRYEAGCGAADVGEPFGAVNVADLLAYLTMFRGQSPGADMNGDGGVNVSDLLSFLAAFREGCD